ncbi:UDP-GlcNAc:undecaprenyl-phosphate GlcNAc-1-phosphate transferase [Cellulosimicrobium cellulans]|uniref:Undecaprenyl-phosphate alpha-N-acetylglucosaminyl 1-phosphate transferase n=1 Tax=Cellulosimicrobium cellulans TaxID=1710 RepID=A0A1Y0HQQ5_CELCE|nr:MraY family glycosyltransferase [Cellulosimicrobium cellulans]ARU50451.1 undecaprenyl-phosphate alpha-N-acetylglucosaminyl 1-phosphate transferase [Cellulosimicrobium cellulans]MBM7820764.1 UDP-GlcNAc:undecaprenyl-phosphate GlcNAc-1-phosphate transferase [Cellulosimicrobium cellulans]
MRVYLLVMLVAAVVTFLTTPFARWVALRTGAITAVRDRDVHTIPTPRLGGLAMLLGLVVAVVFASQMPFLESVFVGEVAGRLVADPRIWGIVGGAAIVCLLGIADDIWDLDWMTKLAGQVLAAGLMATQGVVLYRLPLGIGDQQLIWSSRLQLAATILVVVVAMNAVNFVDGLDGLAAGLVAIGGTAFFVYSYVLTQKASADDYSSLATLVIAALVGVCVGFLPHNFHPARIFMGDSGSMVLGLVMSAAAIVVTGKIETDALSGAQQIPAFIPILLPLAVILLPLLDMGMAVVRRVARGKSPFHPDRMHLHHRMLAIGHSHRRAVLILYVWTAVFAFAAVALVQWHWHGVAVGLAGAVLVSAVLTLGPLRTRGRFLDDDAATSTASVPLATTSDDVPPETAAPSAPAVPTPPKEALR